MSVESIMVAANALSSGDAKKIPIAKATKATIPIWNECFIAAG
jgi:hypothetical protein